MPSNFGEITIVEFQKLLKAIAAARPRFRYNPLQSPRALSPLRPCRYAPSVRHNGETSRCLIGEALHRLGVSDEELMRLDQEDLTDALSVLPSLGFTPNVANYATQVQERQDRGYTWGTAANDEA